MRTPIDCGEMPCPLKCIAKLGQIVIEVASKPYFILAVYVTIKSRSGKFRIMMMALQAV
jgi:hypothetical protein